MNRYKLIATASSIGFYLTVLLSISYFFGYHPERKKIVNFVDKNGTAIKVRIASSAPSSSALPTPHLPPKKLIKKHHPKPRVHKKREAPKVKHPKVAKPKPTPKSKPKPTPKAKPKPKPKAHPKPKTVQKSAKNSENIKKRFQKLKTKKADKVKEAVKKAQTQKRKIDTKKLFSSIKKKPSNSNTNAKSKDSGNSIKKSQKAKGINSKYLAKVQKALMNWPAQANFAGEQIDIVFTIYPSGNFTYHVQKLSQNREFNKELFLYLRQLKKVGFGPHDGSRPYEIEVKFIAHD